jgi:hypothetical protein
MSDEFNWEQADEERGDLTPEEAKWALAFIDMEGDECEWELERESIVPGHTFSVMAMEGLSKQIAMFVVTRVQRRWEATHEPPSALHVTVKVDVG